MKETERHTERILLIDDDQEIGEVVVRFLQGEGYDIQHVALGEDGLELIKRENFDLLLLDVSLPDVNGIEICRRLRSDPHTEKLGILMLTGRGSVNAKVAGLAAGADDYLTKPFDAQELLARVQAQLRLKQLRERLVKMEKIATIGQMVITLSHEINNPLTAIIWHAELLHENLEAGSRIPADALASVKAIEREARRIQQVMSKLSQVSQPVVKEYLPGAKMIDVEESFNRSTEKIPLSEELRASSTHTIT